ncbi:hypothetical protein HUO13_16940 [Saccharopolyspora erythraea]|uniref:hypothetical protein n=1 Tax=Saccharopolyspora erythraea TaxID=1836 RepID=UPI001BF0C2C7|nr:hypothetical protein [Saccharopolyspora erythraea]QUG99388.1 hypothetical protein HUO13_16940 [Saccharopolyspora erythraea]
MTDLMGELLRPDGLCKIELVERIERHIVLVRRAQPTQPAAVRAVTELFTEVVQGAQVRTESSVGVFPSTVHSGLNWGSAS